MFIHRINIMRINNNLLQQNILKLGEGVSLPNANRNFCTFNEQRTEEIVRKGEEALPYIDTFL